MTLFQQFIATVYNLVINGRWSELNEYYSLMREVLKTPVAVITLGNPTDKPL